jgi:hypothetical protein
MAYLGNPIVSTDFPVDTFSGNGSTTAFTLTQAPASVNAIIVAVSGVLQEPSTYTISGTTLTFTAAPPSGTSNISVRHLGVAGIPNTPASGSVQYSSLNSSLQGTLVGRNRIINGNMSIDQRNAGAAVTINGTGLYTLDRWYSDDVSDGSWTIQQSSVAPAGFTNSLLVTITSADSSLGATERCRLIQFIEGFNIADLGWGTANAKTVTLSFWVRGSVTGTFSGSLLNSAENRSYPFTYTINSANTFEYKTITIAGDTSGTWVTNNGTGIRVVWSLGMGSNFNGTAGAWNSSTNFGATGATNLVSTNGATFYITGVQLEVGSTATSFDYRPYGTELALCQRYCIKLGGKSFEVMAMGFGRNTTVAETNYYPPVQMRTTPTITWANLGLGDGSTVTAVTDVAADANQTNEKVIFLVCTVSSGLTQHRPYKLLANNNSAGNLIFSSEL